VSLAAERILPPLAEGWVAMPVRYASTCLDGRRVPLNVEERSRRQGEYPYWGANGIVDGVDEYLFDEPLVLLGEDGAPFFDKTKPVAFFVTGKIWVNNHIHVLRVAPQFDPRFVAHSLNATDYGPWIEGSTRDKLTQDKMGSILLPTPPLSLQCAIADYLDRETARLDALVAVKERVLRLLAEKRRALITCAVTRGLDPRAPLRDSGIPWLGEIPAHWDVMKLKHIASLKSGDFITSDSIAPDGDYPAFGGNGLRGFTSSFTHDGDYILIGRQGALCGNINYASSRFWASEHAVVVHIRGEHLFKWLGKLLEVLNLNQFSQSAAQPGLAVEVIASLGIAVPPLDEQRAIVAHVSAETAKLDALRAATERTISLLRERRAALIAVAVTGAINVGEAIT